MIHIVLMKNTPFYRVYNDIVLNWGFEIFKARKSLHFVVSVIHIHWVQVQPPNHCRCWCCYSKLYIGSANTTIMSFSFINGLCLFTFSLLTVKILKVLGFPAGLLFPKCPRAIRIWTGFYRRENQKQSRTDGNWGVAATNVNQNWMSVQPNFAIHNATYSITPCVWRWENDSSVYHPRWTLSGSHELSNFGNLFCLLKVNWIFFFSIAYHYRLFFVKCSLLYDELHASSCSFTDE